MNMAPGYFQRISTCCIYPAPWNLSDNPALLSPPLPMFLALTPTFALWPQLEMFATQAISWKCRESLGIALELCISSKIEMSRRHLISGEGAFVGHLQWCTDAYCCHGNFGINCPHTNTHTHTHTYIPSRSWKLPRGYPDISTFTKKEN